MTAAASSNALLQGTELGAYLQDEILNVILSSKAYRDQLSKDSTEIVAQSNKSKTESEVEFHFDRILYNFAQSIGLKIQYEKEVVLTESVIRHKSGGRLDTRIGTLVIEYKRKDKLKTKAQQDASIEQVYDYLESIPGSAERQGVVTNGIVIAFAAIDQDGNRASTAFESLSAAHLDRVIKSILLLGRRALSPENLVADFGMNDAGVAKGLVHALHKALQPGTITQKTEMLFSEWKALFKLAHDDKSKQKAITDRKLSLEAVVGIKFSTGDNEAEYKALYAVQTCYAIVVKLIAYRVLLGVRFARAKGIFKDISANSGSIQSYMETLESGSFFRQEGFGNLLEGDFFSWYCSSKQWTQDVDVALRGCMSLLGEYEQHLTLGGAWKVQDLLKDLYMSIMPDKVRHSLGEFYTPAWLADHTVRNAVASCGSVDWRGVDPCCGSGTFLTVMIKMVLDESHDMADSEKLHRVLNNVKGFDLNPLAVLSARINYFINVSHLLSSVEGCELPVYLGDASYVPSTILVDTIPCLSYQITTLKGPLEVTLPVSALKNTSEFIGVISLVEDAIHAEDLDLVVQLFGQVVPAEDKTKNILAIIHKLSEDLIALQKADWNGIWPRIITNFLITANLGKFDIVVGNPPWIDWKNLPAGYRERIKSLCISRHLFSGDRITGGINLNICALICNVVAQHWLSRSGCLSFLMPEPLIFQQSYEGFRRLENTSFPLYFQHLFDWSNAGNPFFPVTQPFLNFVISSKPVDYSAGIPVHKIMRQSMISNGKKKRTAPLSAHAKSTLYADVAHLFNVETLLAVKADEQRTAFSYARAGEAAAYRAIAGVSVYHGREGIELYPQELVLFRILSDRPANKGSVWTTNFQNKKSKHKVPEMPVLLEKSMLRPLIKSTDIGYFNVQSCGLLAAFPYADGQRAPIPSKELSRLAPNTFKHYTRNKSIFQSQSDYNNRIIGGANSGEFYAIARVGAYSYSDNFVCFRDNTKWNAAVVTTIETPWGDRVRPVFQNHAVTISQRPDGTYISNDEAHYICAILNSPVVGKYIKESSDSRSFKIRPQVNIPLFDPNSGLHVRLSSLSKRAHALFGSRNPKPKTIAALAKLLDRAYLNSIPDRT